MAEVIDRASTLVAIASDAIAQRERPAPRSWPEAWLQATGASFVTLRLDAELRGCIGTIDPHRPLGDDVAHNAFAAAYRDPRFPPVDGEERERLVVEVSVLSARVPLPVTTEAEALAVIRPGQDGVYLEFESLRATFLPQVWESIPDPLDFLAELRRKAGLPARFWNDRIRLSRYTVEKFK